MGLNDNPVGQCVGGQQFYVVRPNKITAPDGSHGLRAAVETHCRPGTGPQLNVRVLAGGLHQFHDVIDGLEIVELHQTLQFHYL